MKKIFCNVISVLTGILAPSWLCFTLYSLSVFETRNSLFSIVPTLKALLSANISVAIIFGLVAILIFKLTLDDILVINRREYASDAKYKRASFIMFGTLIAVIALSVVFFVIVDLILAEPEVLRNMYPDNWMEYDAVDSIILGATIMVGGNAVLSFFSHYAAKALWRRDAVKRGEIKKINEDLERQQQNQLLFIERTLWRDKESKYTLEIIPEYDCGVLKRGEDLLGVHFFKDSNAMSISRFYEDNVDYYPQSESEWFAHGEFAYDSRTDELKLDITYIENTSCGLRKGIIRFYKKDLS